MTISADTGRVPAAAGHDGFHRAGIAVRSVVALALGVCALYFRFYSQLLVDAFVAFAILDGLVRLVLALRSTGRDKAWLIHALEGVVTVAVGIIAWQFARSLISLTWTIAEWAFAIGALTIVFAALSWRRLKDAWLWAASGLVLVVLGVAMLWFTLGGLLAPGVSLGLFAIVYGLVTLLIALRRQPHAQPQLKTPPQPPTYS